MLYSSEMIKITFMRGSGNLVAINVIMNIRIIKNSIIGRNPRWRWSHVTHVFGFWRLQPAVVESSTFYLLPPIQCYIGVQSANFNHVLRYD